MSKQETKYLCVIVRSGFDKPAYIKSILPKFPSQNIICVPGDATVQKYCKDNGIMYAESIGVEHIVDMLSFIIVFAKSYITAFGNDSEYFSNNNKPVLILVA